MVGKGFPFTHSLFGTCWLMIVEMMAYFSGILVLEWLPNHTFFFFWKRPSINTGRKNENKENTSAYPVAYKLTKQECRRKAKLTSFSQRQGAQVPSLSTQKNAVNMASIFHPIAIPASWAISAVFLVNQLTELYRMPLCQHRCRSCWRDSERKDVWKRVPGHSIYLFIHLFIHLIFIEHLLTLNHCAKVLRICGEIE